MTVETKVGKIPAKHPLHKEGYEYAGLCSCGFVSYGWPQKQQAQARIDAHTTEHENAGEIAKLHDKALAALADGKRDDASKHFEAAAALMMPDKAEVEALTPDKFAPAEQRTPEDPTGLWEEM